MNNRDVVAIGDTRTQDIEWRSSRRCIPHALTTHVHNNRQTRTYTARHTSTEEWTNTQTKQQQQQPSQAANK
jgi:hypothetical protein